DTADELVDDAGIAADNEAFRHPVDAPLDRCAAVAVLAGSDEGVAVAAEEAPGIFRLVLVVDADEADARIARELEQERRLVVAGDAPGGPDVHQRHVAGEIRRRDAGYRPPLAL